MTVQLPFASSGPFFLLLLALCIYWVWLTWGGGAEFISGWQIASKTLNCEQHDVIE